MSKIAENPLTRKLRMFTDLSQREIAWLDSAMTDMKTIGPETELVRPESVGNQVYVLQAGWAYRYKTLPDGRRQVLNFVLPGDFIGMRAHFFGIADHSIVTLTDATISTFSAFDIANLFQDFPKLAAAITWSAAREEAMLAEHVVRLGRRSAFERTAHLLLELLNRLQAVAITQGQSYAFPITQQLLADTLGLSVVHINRTLRKLRVRGLIEIEGGRIVIKDIPEMERIAAFDGGPIGDKSTPPDMEKQFAHIEIERTASETTDIRQMRSETPLRHPIFWPAD
jgi:CRP-like cAMP-binding protein